MLETLRRSEAFGPHGWFYDETNNHHPIDMQTELTVVRYKIPR